MSIGINLPGPPQWVVVPGLPVYYAPEAPANVFQYNGQCHAFVSGGWYVGPGYNVPWIAVAPAYVPRPSCESQCATITRRPSVGANGILRSGPAGNTNTAASGTGTGKAGAVGGNTMTSRTDERFGPWAGRTASPAKRLTLLCWLLVLSIAVSAECAWVLWLQNVWAVAPAEPSSLLFRPIPTYAAGESGTATRIRATETQATR